MGARAQTHVLAQHGRDAVVAQLEGHLLRWRQACSRQQLTAARPPLPRRLISSSVWVSESGRLTTRSQSDSATGKPPGTSRSRYAGWRCTGVG